MPVPVRPEEVGDKAVVPDLWRWTCQGMSRLLAQAFDPVHGDRVEVTGFGNVLTAVAFLHGLGADELSPKERDVHDPTFPVVVAAMATRGS